MISRKVKTLCFPLVCCMALALVFFQAPAKCYGEEEPCLIRVDVSPHQVNIDGGGVNHYVRVLTYARWNNTEYAFVYINDNEDPIDSEYIVLTRDSVGHLVVEIDLIALQEAELEVDTYHFLKIVVDVDNVHR